MQAQKTRHLLILLCLIFWTSVCCVNCLAETTPTDTSCQTDGFNDGIDRDAEDFVKVSLLVADPTDWKDDILGVWGHAFIRLQCDTFNMDYCFSYESEAVEGNIWRFIKGDLKMGLFVFSTESQIATYEEWNRSIHEYHLNLPPDAEQRLWEIMDNHVNNGIKLKMDLYKRGCAISLVHFVKQALGDTQIEYSKWPDEFDRNPKEIILDALQDHPWIRLVSKFWLDDRFEKDCSNEEKLVIPAQLAEIWQRATLNGKPFAVYIGDLTKVK